jgi:trehalose/maltose transport system substrate-binding protein
MKTIKFTFNRRSLEVALILIICSLFSSPAFAAGVKIRLASDSDVGLAGKWTKARADEWAAKTGNEIEYLSLPPSANEVLTLFSQYWAAQTADIDIYQIDVTWPGIAAPHAIDLKKYFTGDETKQFFPRIIENNTVAGQLVGIPFFTDVGLLYYRTDLLEKYGYKEPPKTWKELIEMAKHIQAGERSAGKPDFWGFVWQGRAYEGLTCDALEWIYSFNGGTIIDSNGKVSVDNPNALDALKMAKSWVGTISPSGVTTYKEEESRNVWQSGNAAFMRNWPYCYALGANKESGIAGKFAVTVLPKGANGGKSAATLGAWQLMVSKYSKNQAVAADLVRYLTSSELQKRDAIELTRLPTRPALYADKEVLAASPWFEQVLPVFSGAVARPSTILKGNYNQFASNFFDNVNKALNSEESPEQALQTIDAAARRLVH